MPRPRKLIVEKYLNDEQTAKLEGKWIDLSYVKHPVIRSNVDVYYKDEDGKEHLLLKYRKNCISNIHLNSLNGKVIVVDIRIIITIIPR